MLMLTNDDGGIIIIVCLDRSIRVLMMFFKWPPTTTDKGVKLFACLSIWVQMKGESPPPPPSFIALLPMDGWMDVPSSSLSLCTPDQSPTPSTVEGKVDLI